jgi:hypothetical protein
MITVKKDGNGWRLVDDKGRLHSARIADKARAQRQADQLNAQLDKVKRGFSR